MGYWSINEKAKRARLTELWDDGKNADGEKLSARLIADILVAEFGDDCSRNMVIGKAHRLGLSVRESPLVLSGEDMKTAVARAMATRARRANMNPDELAADFRQGFLDRYDSAARKRGMPSYRTRGKALELAPSPAPTTAMKIKPVYLPANADVGRPATCQFIEGTPSMDDSVKCGAPRDPKSPAYCTACHARCYKKYTDKERAAKFALQKVLAA